jgi:2'-5' RNA ligase
MPRAASTQDGEERWRCFVAVPISDELRALLADYVAEMRQLPGADSWRWTDADGWHITLAFLGSISPASVPEIAAKLREVAARHSPFTVETGDLGAFPSWPRARVLWSGVHDPARRFEALAHQVRLELELDEEEAPPRSHVTLARARSGGGRFPAPGLPVPFEDAPALRLLVDRLDLYRTHQDSGGSRYEILSRHVLSRVQA